MFSDHSENKPESITKRWLENFQMFYIEILYL